MPGPHPSAGPAASAVEAGEEGPAACAGVGLGEPAAVLGEEEVSVQGEVDIERPRVRQSAAVAVDELRRQAEVPGERGELLLRGDLGAAAHGVQEPVLLGRVADQQLHLRAPSGSQRLQRVGGQEVPVGDRTVDRRIVMALPGAGVLPVAVDDLVRRGHQRLR
ncbi:hypothetical protein Smic_73720 [Streptomyces microflavus]|uniref:Uncharacterized protein n=1 Tax=Streptomyces microflavus TaxID=1919 RepID=A0A7J0D241_STRMI|nr:hypothetical protein Smic_73720 [Streptomyces microflavus]